jgi:hypothetical protein
MKTIPVASISANSHLLPFLPKILTYLALGGFYGVGKSLESQKFHPSLTSVNSSTLVQVNPLCDV